MSRLGPLLSAVNRAAAGAPGHVNVTCTDATPEAPATNLRQPWSYRPMVTRTGADVTIRLDFGTAAHDVAVLALGVPNAPPTATVEATLYAGLFEAPVATLPPSPAWGDPDPRAALLESRYWVGPILGPGGAIAPVAARSIELTLRAGAAGLAAWELCCLWAGPAARLSRMPAWPPSTQPVHFNPGQRSATGYPQPQAPGRTLIEETWTFHGLTSADWWELTAAQIITRGQGPVLWQLDPEGVLPVSRALHRGLYSFGDAFSSTARYRAPGLTRYDVQGVTLTPW